MPPALGQTVIVFTDPQYANGSDTAPAVITRVWTDELVSVRIFHDGPCGRGCTDRGTMILYDSRELAEAAPRAAWLRPSGAWRPPQDPGLAPEPVFVPGGDSRLDLLAEVVADGS